MLLDVFSITHDDEQLPHLCTSLQTSQDKYVEKIGEDKATGEPIKG